MELLSTLFGPDWHHYAPWYIMAMGVVVAFVADEILFSPSYQESRWLGIMSLAGALMAALGLAWGLVDLFVWKVM